jgi:hypothetical protein
MSDFSAGKGDKPRPVDYEKYARNYERIFRKYEYDEDDFNDPEEEFSQYSEYQKRIKNEPPL